MFLYLVTWYFSGYNELLPLSIVCSPGPSAMKFHIAEMSQTFNTVWIVFIGSFLAWLDNCLWFLYLNHKLQEKEASQGIIFILDITYILLTVSSNSQPLMLTKENPLLFLVIWWHHYKKNTHVNSLTCHFKVTNCVPYSRLSVFENKKKNSPVELKKEQRRRRGGKRGGGGEAKEEEKIC